MRLLYVGPHCEAPPVDSVCGFRTGRGRVCCVRIGNHHHRSGRAPAICVPILCVLFYPPGLVGCREYSPSCFVLVLTAGWFGMVIFLGCCFIRTELWSAYRIIRWWCGLQRPAIVLREPPTLGVAFVWAAKAVFFGGQDLGPSIIEQILARLKLQLLLP